VCERHSDHAVIEVIKPEHLLLGEHFGEDSPLHRAHGVYVVLVLRSVSDCVQ
jgi:hypothetical protein